MPERLVQVAAAAVAIPLALFAYLALVETLLGRLPYRWRHAIRPWLWIAPALALLGLFQGFPLINSVVLSLVDRGGERFVFADNFLSVLGDPQMQTALRNSVSWLIVLTTVTVGLGLFLAVLTDRVPFERFAKAVLFMYDYRPASAAQTGTLNAAVTAVGGEPHAWLVDPSTNNLALIFSAVWMFTGFALVILSAGLKGLPRELLEASRVDGASEWQVLRHITVPLLWPTIAVVATTTAIGALKAFDIVYVMTNGNFETDVIATRMYKELFSSHDFGRASAIAVVLLAMVLPIMAWNLRVYRRQEATR
jgi:alpha-glucoside transport system permease protein